MAPTAERSGSSQEALLQLEKGTTGPSSLLKDAAKIVGIDLALCAGDPDANYNLQLYSQSAPKEEWVLRWLLKKLKSTKAYRIEPRSFVLFQQLIHRIPPKCLAAILSEYRILTIVNDAVADTTAGIVLNSQDVVLDRSDSESSRTLDEESSPKHKKHDNETRKRKRAIYEEDDVDPNSPPCFALCASAFSRLLNCLYTLVVLANKMHDVDGVASSHLKHALRGEPGVVAKILARSLALSALLIFEFRREKRAAELHHLLRTLPSVLDLWELRSSHQDDSNNSFSNAAFAHHCFLEALRLHHSASLSGVDSNEATNIVQQVERLVALHVVLPARGAFFAKGGSGIDYSTDEPDWSPVKPISDTFRPLLMDNIDGKAGLLEHKEQKREARTKIDKKTGSRNPVLKPAELLPIFLDIAIRSVPRDTFRRQTNEGPWLETLFVAIAELAFSAVKQEETADVTSDFISILEQMFRIILNRGVKLSLHTLITHAAYTGLFKDNLDKVQWRLTALLVELGVDIFLPNSGLPDSARLLAALLEKIMLHWTSGYPGGDGMYAKVKTDIVVPLLRGFASARDLLTFVQLWYEQLVLVELARSSNRGLARFSIWESDDLANVCSELMKTSLTEAQVSSLAQNTLSELLSESGAIAVSANAFGRFVTLEAASRNLTCDTGSDRTMSVLTTVTKALVATISSKQNMHWRWRLWRFSGNVLEFAMKSTDGSFDGTLGSLVNSAENIIRDLHNQPMSRQQDFAEILEAYRFVLTATEKTSDNTYSNQLALLTADIPPFLKTIVIKEVSVSDASWDGHIETLDSAIPLATGYLVTLLRAPEIWGKTKAETRQALYDQMLSLAAIQQQSMVASSSINSSPLNAQFLQLWNALVSYEYLLNSPEIVNDLLVVLIERLKNDPSIRQLTVMSLQKIPSRFVTRHHRGLLLDFLGHIILEKASPEISGDMLSLMATLANMPKSSAKVTNDWEVVWKIAKAISFKDSEIDFHVMKSFRSLVEAVMSKFLTLSEKDRQKYFKKIHQKTTSSVYKFKSIKHPTLEFYLVRILLSQLWNYRLELSSVFDEANLKSHRQKVFKYLLEDLETLQAQFKREVPNLTNEICVAKILAVLEDFEDIVRENDEIEKYMAEIEDCVTKTSAGLAASLQRSIKRHVLARTNPGRSLTIPLVKCGDVFSLQHLFAEEQQVLIRDAAKRFHEMSSDDLTGLIEDIRKSGFSGKNASYRLLIAGLAVTCLKPVEEKESASSQGLSLLCTAVAESLHTSTSIEQFSLAAECLDILLRCHSRAITQWNVDNILAAVTVAISKCGPQISPEFAGTIYVRLCRLVGVLFVLYRQKLGGRFHLILPAMQRLLTCLFTPNRKRKAGARTKPTQSQPPWLGSLNDSHAVHFTRLLISLCEPTVSAVSKSSQSSTGHEALTDQTKKAKRVAGQHLQYLIIEYTQCTLRGIMNSEIKTALLPGLYAVLDVMSRDTMKALNASLDASGRAVFKTLYDDYVKFGKWHES